jgi:hypothetical protein
MVMAERWQTVEHPGYFGKGKDAVYQSWDQKYGSGNWRLAWDLRDGSTFNYEGIFWKIYVPGYAHYFNRHRWEARWITRHFAYAYDKDLISKEEAFDPLALYEKPGRPNQFHHAAFNIALEYSLGLPFQGQKPLQVREGKSSVPKSEWPLGWRWSPGRVPAVRPDLIPELVELDDTQKWAWNLGSIEDCYQSSKSLQVKIISPDDTTGLS